MRHMSRTYYNLFVSDGLRRCAGVIGIAVRIGRRNSHHRWQVRSGTGSESPPDFENERCADRQAPGLHTPAWEGSPCCCAACLTSVRRLIPVPISMQNSVLCRRFAHLPDEAGSFPLEGEGNCRFGFSSRVPPPTLGRFTHQ